MQDECVLAKVLVDAQAPELPCGSPIALTVPDASEFKSFLKLDPKSYNHLVAGDSAAPPLQPKEKQNSSVLPTVSTSKDVTQGAQRFSPAARHLIESKSLDASKILGTVKKGVIGKHDVIAAMKSGSATTAAKTPKSTSAAQMPTRKEVKSVNAATPAAPKASTSDNDSNAPVNQFYTDVPNSNMRKVIAKRLTESKARVPHFYTSIECSLDEVLALRKTLKQNFDVGVSVNDIVIKAASLALRDNPAVNAKWNSVGQTVRAPAKGVDIDVSVAVATPSGLITPILFAADKKGLLKTNDTVKELAGRARVGKLKPEEYQGGSFSISNLGTLLAYL